MTEKTYDVHWLGPFQPDDLKYDENSNSSVHKNNVLYMICGTHGLYGRNVPLYIGKTEQEIENRIRQHQWLDEEPDEVKVYVATIAPFESWEFNTNKTEYPPPKREIIEAVESLLIFAHQPAYNHVSKKQVKELAHSTRVFNTGRRSTLFPELSGRYYVSP